MKRKGEVIKLKFWAKYRMVNELGRIGSSLTDAEELFEELLVRLHCGRLHSCFKVTRFFVVRHALACMTS